MKIEMGESLMLTWLKHINGCQIVQLNWKPSNIWPTCELDKIENLIKAIREYDDFSKYVFFENIEPKQIINQGEIDTLGIKLTNNQIETLYCVDIAFHALGINYGSKDATIVKVLEKLIRMAASSIYFFEAENTEIFFTTPKINNNLITDLQEGITSLNNFFIQQKYPNIIFRLITNEEFKNEIIDPVLLQTNYIADTSELFVRSIQLYKMFYTEMQLKTTRNRITRSSSSEDEIQSIGSFVKSSIPDLITNNRITDQLINNLLDIEYSKRNFGISFPFLSQEINKRYWKEAYNINDVIYYVCSQWYEKNRNKYLTWLNDL